MASFFEKIESDAKGLETELLGPSYSYVDQIKTPEQMGMSATGSLGTLESDIGGLISYVELLAEGNSNASLAPGGGPLGDKFFLETAAKCNDITTSSQVTRSLYMNNVPDGNIPFISSGMGVDFSEFRGIVPGVIGNLSNINPLLIFRAFVAGSMPNCRPITMETIDQNNNVAQQTAYVTDSDIGDMDACWFPNGTNPVNSNVCKEAFTNQKSHKTSCCAKMPDDLFVKIYYSALGILGLYILLMIYQKKK